MATSGVIEVSNGSTPQNAGHRLWKAQRAQGTGLCIGLDPHIDPGAGLGEAFYTGYLRCLDKHGDAVAALIHAIARAIREFGPSVVGVIKDTVLAADFVAGLTIYFIKVVEAAWTCGIRVFKPNIAFYEQLGPFGPFVLSAICKRIRDLAGVQPYFIILDAKRGDIDTTQAPYYRAYLSSSTEPTIPGMNGFYGFDAMTITTWMGNDVIMPGLNFFRNGRGAIVVTRTSNPSGCSLQDARILTPPPTIILSDKQKPYVWTPEDDHTLVELVEGERTFHHAMLYLTTRVSTDQGLEEPDGVSPIFSVMGATTKMDGSFRRIRGQGAIALVPGFGAQKGSFDNIMPLAVTEGPLTGHLGILSTSRAHNFPWLNKYGGDGNPGSLHVRMGEVVSKFREEEREAYKAAGIDYPF